MFAIEKYKGYTSLKICNYRFIFSNSAGPGDIMTILVKRNENSIVKWGVGTAYTTALDGPEFDDAAGQKITVPYPMNVFITMMNSGSQGEFELVYSYLD